MPDVATRIGPSSVISTRAGAAGAAPLSAASAGSMPQIVNPADKAIIFMSRHRMVHTLPSEEIPITLDHKLVVVPDLIRVPFVNTLRPEAGSEVVPGSRCRSAGMTTE